MWEETPLIVRKLSVYFILLDIHIQRNIDRERSQ